MRSYPDIEDLDLSGAEIYRSVVHNGVDETISGQPPTSECGAI